MKKTALIIGLSSQDGSYLADLLLEKGYNVVGTIRRSTTHHRPNMEHLIGRVTIEALDLLDDAAIAGVIMKHKPDEIYNIAAQSVPGDCWTQPMYTAEITGLGPVRVLEAARRIAPEARVYQATSREIFGGVVAEYASEETGVRANNPYGIAKAYAHMMVGTYRDSYGLYATSGILFNHESPRRSLHFVTRKVTAAVACIKNGVSKPPVDELGRPLVDPESGQLMLGHLDSQRDWGYAGEYVEAMWLMLQQDAPKDYVIGTGTSFSVRDLCSIAFDYAGLDWERHVVQDPNLLRPTEITELKADTTLATSELGWTAKISFTELVEMMVRHDLQEFS